MLRLMTFVMFALSLSSACAADPAADSDAAIAAMFKAASGDWMARTVQDPTQRTCSLTRNAPSDEQADEIKTREAASIAFPEDGIVLGDWKKGELVAQSGAGGQFTDGPDTVNGGNCYACHQLAPAEISHGTLGPSLTAYGKIRNFKPDEARAAYAKIFNAQSVLACSAMPRFGYHKVLTIEQIKDVTAYLMSPESPVNK